MVMNKHCVDVWCRLLYICIHFFFVMIINIHTTVFIYIFIFVQGAHSESYRSYRHTLPDCSLPIPRDTASRGLHSLRIIVQINKNPCIRVSRIIILTISKDNVYLALGTQIHPQASVPRGGGPGHTQKQRAVS